jgi:hypothetical protein
MKKEINGISEKTSGPKISSVDKEVLLSENQKYQEALEGQITKIRDNAEHWLKTGAIIGGAVFVGYSFYKLFMEKQDNDNNLIESNDQQDQLAMPATTGYKGSPIVRMIMESIAMFLISIAKEKLTLYLNKLDEESISIDNAQINDEQEDLG